jgi:hypothetical protein
MQVIKIDSLNKTISYVDIDNTLESIYKHLDCELFTCPIILDNLDTLYIDDEGLLIDNDDYKGAFYFNNFGQPLFGYGLIIGTSNNGESVNVLSDIKSIESKVSFISEETGRYFLDKLKNNINFKIYTY